MSVSTSTPPAAAPVDRPADVSPVAPAVIRRATVADAAAIRHAAGLCLKRVDLTRRLRLLGVRAASLVRV